MGTNQVFLNLNYFFFFFAFIRKMRSDFAATSCTGCITLRDSISLVSRTLWLQYRRSGSGWMASSAPQWQIQTTARGACYPVHICWSSFFFFFVFVWHGSSRRGRDSNNCCDIPSGLIPSHFSLFPLLPDPDHILPHGGGGDILQWGQLFSEALIVAGEKHWGFSCDQRRWSREMTRLVFFFFIIVMIIFSLRYAAVLFCRVFCFHV